MIDLTEYDLVIVNSSAGKDSLCALYQIMKLADLFAYDRSKIVVSHQDLGDMEWKGTKELVKEQADLFGLETYYSKRRDKNGYEENLLEYAERRQKWPSNMQRWCTSDFKRSPGSRVVTMLTKGKQNCKVLYVFGFRSEESPARSKKEVLKRNKMLTTKSRIVDEYLPIHDWTETEVWNCIKDNNLPYHPAYDLGMPRLSCVFCIFSPFDALVRAGYANPELLDRYCETETKINHTFREDLAINDVRKAIQNNYQPKQITNWVM
jgi:3'-phosphoadenosine 5'-phosphosulfate sulfotransferase (PAPS reductase)/FAD synthetase